MKRTTTILVFLMGLAAWSKPTSNVINAVYSLQDEFFQKYNYPAISFKDRVTICESFNSIHADSLTLGAIRTDKMTLDIHLERQDHSYADHLYFRLIRDKNSGRHILFIFHQRQKNTWTKLLRADVIQYDKNVEGRWRPISLSDVLPPVGWQQMFDGISADAMEKVFAVKPAFYIRFRSDGSIDISCAYDYINTELTEVAKYIEENALDPKSCTLRWDKEQSKFIADNS